MSYRPDPSVTLSHAAAPGRAEAATARESSSAPPVSAIVALVALVAVARG